MENLNYNVRKEDMENLQNFLKTDGILFITSDFLYEELLSLSFRLFGGDFCSVILRKEEVLEEL